MANVVNTPGVLTLDTAAIISATLPFHITQIVYAAPAAAVGACTLEDGEGRLIATLRAPVSGLAVVNFGHEGKKFVGLELATITASSNLTIYCKD
jgi:hypothetical protein